MEAESIMFQIVSSEATPSGDTIQCHLSPEISADDVEIRWFKETECVCFYKNGRFIEGIGYEGRVSLCNEELKRGNVSLQLKESDDGDYLCQVISGNRREEKTVSKPLKPTTRTVWTEQPDKRWTDKERMEMANSALSAVFQTLENIVAQTEKNRLQKDLQDIKATVLQTSREMEEKQNQKDESAQMRDYEEIGACEPEERTTTQLDNQQSDKLFGSYLSSWFTRRKNPEPPVKNMQQMKSTSSRSVKYFLSVTGDAQKHHMHFINDLKKNAQEKHMSLMEVSTVKDSDVIFLFCPDVTEDHRREDKPVILISLYNTMDPKPSSKRQMFVPVECVFDHKGLLDCQINRDEISVVSDFLQQKSDL